MDFRLRSLSFSELSMDYKIIDLFANYVAEQVNEF